MHAALSIVLAGLAVRTRDYCCLPMDFPATRTAASDEASTSQSSAPRPTTLPRSHRRKDGQPPRPPNAWICYRAARSQELRAQPEYARVAQSEICESASAASTPVPDRRTRTLR